MRKFEVGDRVRHEKFGEGTIMFIEEDPQPYGIEFDEYMDGHDCEKRCKLGHGWYCEESELTKLRKVSPRKAKDKRCGVVITTKSGASCTVGKISPRKEKKKRPALWIETAGRHIILRGRKGFKMYTPDGYYTNTSHCNQQARRLAKQLGIEVRK